MYQYLPRVCEPQVDTIQKYKFYHQGMHANVAESFSQLQLVERTLSPTHSTWSVLEYGARVLRVCRMRQMVQLFLNNVLTIVLNSFLKLTL